MVAPRKQYMFRDTSVILESSPDDEMPYIVVHADRGGALKGDDLFSLSYDLQALLEAAYKSNEIQTSTSPKNTAKSIGFRISYTGDGYTVPKPDELFQGAVAWLDKLAGNIVEADGDFNKGLELTKKNIALNTSQPDTENLETEGEQQWQAKKTYDKDLPIGRLGVRIHFSNIDEGKFTLSFDDGTYEIPDIKETASKLAEAIAKYLNQNGIPTTYFKPLGVNDLNHNFTLNDATPLQDVSHKLDSLLVSIIAQTKHQKDEGAALDSVLQGMAAISATDIKTQLTTNISATLNTLLENDPLLAAKKDEIAAAVTAAILQPFPDPQTAITAMQTDKGDGSVSEIRRRVKDALGKYLGADTEGKKIYFATELGSVFCESFPKKAASHGQRV